MASDLLAVYVPSEPSRPPGVLQRWSASLPAGWVSRVLDATTRPGDLVVDPFCQGDAVVRGALRLGRSVAASDFNPVQTLAARAAFPPPSQTLARATVRLADSAKVDRGLRDHIRSLYITRCPHCSGETIAESFMWDGTAGVPTRKSIACATCGWRGAAPADRDDVARANELEPLSLGHWHLVERLAEPNDRLRPLAERIVDLYTPRAQRALADLLRHADGLELPPDEGEALRMVLLGCLDVCSNLNATPWDTAPPRRLEPPRRYAEVNVWHAFETLAATLRAAAQPADVEWVAEPGALHTGVGLPFAFIGRMPIRLLGEALPAAEAALVIGAPPRMTSLFWILSWAWASWLWSRRAGAPLRPLVERGTPTWEWYAAATAASLASLRTALRPDAHLALRWSAEHAGFAALVQAAVRAGFRLESAVVHAARPGGRWAEAQAVFRRLPDLPRRRSVDELSRVSRALEVGAAETAEQLLRTQGEPLGAEILLPAALTRAAQTGLLAEAIGLFDEPQLGLEFAQAKGSDGLAEATADTVSPLVRLDDGRFWLINPRTGATPLPDRLERSIVARLSDAALTLADVYATEAGFAAPDHELVDATLQAHSREVTPHVWAADDTVDALRQAVADLVVIGEALGYTVQFPLPWALNRDLALKPAEVLWLAGGRPTMRFVLQTGALLSSHLATLPYPIPHYLVVPARVTRLIQLKLRRAPHLAQALAADWEFIIAERLHRWVTTPGVDSEEWRSAIGLAERSPDDGQLRLFDTG